MSLTARTTLYSLMVAFGIFQNIIAIFASLFDGFAGPKLTIFEGIAAGWALCTWVWASVLLSYNNRPLSSHTLVRASAHLISLIIFAVGWLVLIILLGTQFHLQCDFSTYSDGEAGAWCATSSTSFGLAILLCGFCSTSAAIVYRAARRTGLGLSSNVALGDKVEPGSVPLV